MKKEVPQTDAASPTILLVDDEPSMLTLLERILSPHYHTVSAVDVAGARERIESEDISVIVCDHVLPDGKGLAFLNELRRVHHPAISILITGYSKEGLAIEAANSGAVFRYLKKPFTSSALLQTVQDALREQRRGTEQKEAVRRQSRFGHKSPMATRTAVFIHYVGMTALAIAVLFALILILGVITLMVLYFLKSGLGIDIFEDVHFRDLLP